MKIINKQYCGEGTVQILQQYSLWLYNHTANNFKFQFVLINLWNQSKRYKFSLINLELAMAFFPNLLSVHFQLKIQIYTKYFQKLC